MQSADAPGSGSGAPPQEVYGPDEVGMFFGALASARDRFGHVIRDLAREYGIGPRGPWMVGVIGRQPASPHQLAEFFSIGRSLVTAELRQLQSAGLIAYSKSKSDGRMVTLSLTSKGVELRERVTASLGRMLQQRLAGYSKREVMQCARLLNDFAQGNPYATLAVEEDPED
ncbi:MarR family winged helix-turn-helix transcriptional regulator [Novosphingobium sp. M1R2S20]|uniref:MarR family winged helix-turn-helix transcriptional regulator n=1 Tax=Novosphingobium rhizovicinum TaxID=3228928 RepID=A0ABV3REV4_9SPHN